MINGGFYLPQKVVYNGDDLTTLGTSHHAVRTVGKDKQLIHRAEM